MPALRRLAISSFQPRLLSRQDVEIALILLNVARRAVAHGSPRIAACSPGYSAGSKLFRSLFAMPVLALYRAALFSRFAGIYFGAARREKEAKRLARSPT